MNDFELIRTEEVNELNTTAKIYRHIPTGAEILSMENDDENKCFGIAFRTPPSDSTGVAHILEHTVLCGSEKYPVKDPFVQLLKGSLQTFLNAFTYPDKTCYPVASQNLKDFHNLVDVYLDAVFNPRITEDFFMQEGWHYSLENKEDDLKFKGVVYNEMKGVYSSPDSLLMEASQQSLYPDTTYGLDSGGNPANIPDLTYEQFKAFHDSLYHPSNARIFFYGDDPVEERFKLLKGYLGQYTKSDPDSNVQLQPALPEPVRVEKSYAVSTDDEDPQPMFTVNWSLPSPTDAETVFAFNLLDHILLGTPASPLRKGLIESGLGEDITGGGIETHMIQMMYSIGLKGIDAENLDKGEALVFQILENLVKQGIDPDDIAAALNTFEFELRENNSGGFPRGLSLWLKSLNAWIYDADPLELIAFEEPLQHLKKRALEPGYFENMIREYFINNTHRSTVLLIPDREFSARTEKEEQDRLAAIKASMTEQQLNDIVTNTKRLLELQSTPDSDEALSTIPLLQREDLDKKVKTVPFTTQNILGTTVVKHDLFTNGILYLDIGLNLHGLDQEDLPYASLLGSILLEMGTQSEDYVTLSQRIAKATGGIYGTPFLSAQKDNETGITRFFLRGKCMTGQTKALLDIMHDILLTAKFDDKERFKQIVLEHKSELETGVVPRGHSAVMTRLKAQHHEAHWANEMMGGVEALFFIRKLADELDQNWDAILQRLEKIRQTLVCRDHILINVTVDPGAMETTIQTLEQFIENLPATGAFSSKVWKPAPFPESEALTAPTMVNYVGCAANLFDAGYKMHGSAMVITRYLQTAWLWEKIRVQGGAYGGMCAFDQRSGVFTFASYRDPNLENSLEVYKQTGEYLKNLQLSEDELTRALIGAIGTLDAYQLPDAKGYSSTMRYLLNYTDEERQKLRDEVLATTQAHFNTFGDVLIQAFENSAVSVLCSPESAERAGLLTRTKVL
ncbi:insulinase family protein [Pontiella agarivorans]|uniref:Insulinase family protein n=1 Tax=Pontiella agarivorans TaxID=3038953 RepID=A0ABU5N104_9BACT|nr:insulinase family protein [Pontiella agarivorans]MDZ8120118.1 insulinase family protein [Pontiella agarivorans]